MVVNLEMKFVLKGWYEFTIAKACTERKCKFEDCFLYEWHGHRTM